jgi:hypothetical protein
MYDGFVQILASVGCVHNAFFNVSNMEPERKACEKTLKDFKNFTVLESRDWAGRLSLDRSGSKPEGGREYDKNYRRFHFNGYLACQYTNKLD